MLRISPAAGLSVRTEAQQNILPQIRNTTVPLASDVRVPDLFSTFVLL